MKKLISYLVIMTMFLNLFVFALPVTADTTFDGTVYELDFTKLTSLEGTNVAVTSDDYVKVSLTSEGLKMEQIASKLLNDSEARNTANAGAIKGGFVVTLDKDDANRTVTVADKLKGKFDLIFDYAANVDRYSTHPDDTNIKIEGYYVFNVGNSSSPKQFNSMKENVLITRVDQKNYTTLNSASQTTSTMSKVKLTANNLGGAEHSVKVSYDTESKTQTVMLDNDETLVSTGPMGGTQGYVNAFVMMGLQRMNVGAYLTLKKVQVANYTPDSATQTILNALPAKLADDVNAVKENITIPVIDGVTWKTSDASVISETGVVTRGEADKTVTITATCDGITKTYKMTVAKEEVVVPDEPDEPVIPDEPDEPSNDSVNYEVDFTKLTSLENVNWKVEGSDYINAHLTSDGLKFEQTDSKIFNDAGERNTTATGKIQAGFVIDVDKDAVNRTTTKVKELRGKFDIIVDYKANVDRYQTHPENGKKIEGYYLFTLGTIKDAEAITNLQKTSLFARIDQNNVQVLNINSQSSSTMTPLTLNKINNLNGAEHTMRISYDTAANSQTVMIDNNSELVSTGVLGAELDYINALSITGLERMNVGAYFTIRKFQIANYEMGASAKATLNLLPAKLVDDVNAVTENIVLPNVAGVTWTTSNKNIIGEDGTVKRPSKDTDVTLTASFGGVQKAYTMTVLKAESTDPDAPVIPDVEEGNTLVYDMPEYATYGQASNEWFVTNSGTNEVYVENGSLIIKDKVGGDGNLADGSLNSAFAVNAGITFEGVVSTDDVNNTEIATKTFSGKYALEFTYKTNMTTDRHQATDKAKLNNAYYFITLGYRDPSSKTTALTDEYADLRIPGSAKAIGATPTDSTPYFYHANATGTKVNYNLTKVNNEQEVTFRFVFDTNEKVINAYVLNTSTGDFDLVKEDIPFISGFGSSGIFNAMLFKCQEAYNEGSYIEIKDLKLYEVLPDVYDTRYINALTAMAKMPEKLVENPLNVTSDITNIPTEVDGIKLNWSTGNVMVLTKEGKVTNWVDASDTYLGASVSFADPDDTTKSPLVYTKKYKVTIPAMEGAESKLVYTGTFDNNWKFGYIYSTKTADHEFTENSLKFEQITTDDPTAYTNKKNHYGILRFNGVEIPYDEETRAEVYSDTFSGIYDFEFDLQANIASEERPVSVDLGFYDTVNDVFKILGSVETYTNKTQLRVWTSSSRSEAYEFTGSLVNKTNIRLRVDTTINKMWVFIGETLVTEPEGISYYNPVGEKGIINAMRIAMDENLELGDTAEISNIKLTQKLLNEVAEKADLIKAAEGITVNMITNTPSAVTGSIKTLPSKVGAYDVKWSSLSPDIINVETGSVYGTETENEVFVVAEIYDASANNPVNVKKSFKLTVPEASASGVIAYRLNLFELSDYVKQPLNSISYDLDLPSADAFGSSVSWKSSNTAVIDNDGNLAENVTKATKVTLTATLSANGASGTKTFEITVMPKTAENVVYSGTGESFTVGGVENASVYGNVSVTVTKDTEDTVAVYNKDGDKVAEVNFADYGKTTLSIVFMPDEGVYNVLDAEGNILDECLPMLVDSEEISSVTGATVTVKADTFTVLKTAMNYVNYTAPSAVVEDQNFPMEDVMGAKVTWVTDNTSVITNTGKLTVPETYKFVTITCTLTLDGYKVSKEYKVPVPCSQTKNVLKDATVTANSSAQAGHSLKFVTDGDAETYGAIAYGTSGAYFEATFEEAYINTVYVAQPEENIKNYVVECLSDNTWKTVATGDMESKKFELITFDNTLATRVRIKIEGAEKSVVALSAFEGFLYASANELMKLDLEALKLDAPYEIKTDITLPETGKYGTVFTWSSDNENVISNTGKYTQPAKSTVVTLKAKIPTGETKEFKFFAVGKSGGAGASPSGGGAGGGGGGASSGGTILGGGAIVAAPESTTTAESNAKPMESVFGDVPADSWYYNYVKDLKNKGIISGDDKGNFNPSANVTREEFVKMLVIASGVSASENEVEFSDVNSDAWYYEYVKIAVSAGIVNGVSATEFGAGTRISRQDMAVMLYRILKAEGKTYTASSDKFADDANIADYAKEAVYAMKQAGILNGSDGKYNPTAPLTRAESAKVISVLNNLLSK